MHRHKVRGLRRAVTFGVLLGLAACDTGPYRLDVDAAPGVMVERRATGETTVLSVPIGTPGPALRVVGDVGPGTAVTKALEQAGRPVSGTFISRHTSIQAFCDGAAEVLVLGHPLSARQQASCLAFAIAGAGRLETSSRTAIYVLPRVTGQFTGVAIH